MKEIYPIKVQKCNTGGYNSKYVKAKSVLMIIYI